MNKSMLRNLALFVALTTPLPAIFGSEFHEDFTDGLGAYTAAVLLGAHRNHVTEWETVDGALRINTSEADPDDPTGAMQHFLSRTDVRLKVGFEWRAAFSPDFTGPNDIGVAVGAHQTIRRDFIHVHTRSDGRVFSRGLDGGSPFPLVSADADHNFDTLFIARIEENVFELGYYDGDVRTVIVTREMSSADVGNAIGFYADVRGAGVLGAFTSATLHRPDIGTLLELSQVRIGSSPDA